MNYYSLETTCYELVGDEYDRIKKIRHCIADLRYNSFSKSKFVPIVLTNMALKNFTDQVR